MNCNHMQLYVELKNTIYMTFYKLIMQIKFMPSKITHLHCTHTRNLNIHPILCDPIRIKLKLINFTDIVRPQSERSGTSFGHPIEEQQRLIGQSGHIQTVQHALVVVFQDFEFLVIMTAEIHIGTGEDQKDQLSGPVDFGFGVFWVFCFVFVHF